MSAVVFAMVTLFSICSADGKSTRLPADIPILDGHRVNAVCGSCCQGGSYCGVVPEDTRIGSRLLISKGSNMTCVLRSRSTYGAVDGGLCVPSHIPDDFPLPELCRALDKVSAGPSQLQWQIDSCGRHLSISRLGQSSVQGVALYSIAAGFIYPTPRKTPRCTCKLSQLSCVVFAELSSFTYADQHGLPSQSRPSRNVRGVLRRFPYVYGRERLSPHRLLVLGLATRNMCTSKHD